MKKYGYWSIIIFFCFYSCEKSKVEEQLLHPEGEFIEANIEDDFFHFTGHRGYNHSNIYTQDSFSFTFQGALLNITINQLTMSRYSDDGKSAFFINISHEELIKENVPITITLPISSLNSAQLQWYNSPIQKSGNISLTIKKWDDNNYLEGTFEGQVTTTGTNTLEEVTDGKFRIQVFD